MPTASRGSESSGKVQFGFVFGVSSDESSDSDSKSKQSEEDDINFYLRHSSAVQSKPAEVEECFDHLMSTVFSRIISDSLEQIDVLAIFNKLPETDINLEYVAMYENYRSNTQNYDDSIYSMETWQINFNKFRKDVWYLEKVLRVTLDDLQNNRNFAILDEVLRNYKMKLDSEFLLLSSRQFNQKELAKLRKMQEKEREDFNGDILELANKISNKQNEYNDLFEKFKVENHIMKCYENSRCELNTQVLKGKEFGYRNTIDENNLKIDDENFIHLEIASFFEVTDDNNRNSIEYWIEKYDKDFDDLELETNKLRMKIEKQEEDFKTLKEEYERRVKAIEDYLEHKRIKKIEADELERLNYAATRIQAWWRGVMVRKHLGPYSKKKKGKNAKKGSAKSNKKKK